MRNTAKQQFGVIKLTLHANSYDWEFLPVPGVSFTDRGSGTCHGAPPPPARLEIDGGNNQTAPAGTAVRIAPAVKVLTASGDPRPSVTVKFTIRSGGGKLTGASAISDGNGIARVGSWTLGTTPGTNTIRAAIPNTTVPTVTFTATGT